MKVKLFTHTDLDGIGCAVLAKLAFGDNIDISYCNYNNINTEVEKVISQQTDYDIYFITDISITEEIAEKINMSYKNVYLLDHHPTALFLNKYSWCKVQINNQEEKLKTSGTELLYYWLLKNNYLDIKRALKLFVWVVTNYDTWEWVNVGKFGTWSKDTNDLFTILGKDKFIEWAIKQIKENIFPKFNEEENLLLSIRQEEISAYIKKKNEQIIKSHLNGYQCVFVFAEQYISELGNKLCELHPEVDFVVIIDISNNKVSYRTIKNNIDLGKDIAKAFGGGGHPKAAGSQISKMIQYQLIHNIFEQEE